MKKFGFLGWVALAASSLTAAVACQLEAEPPAPVVTSQRALEGHETQSVASPAAQAVQLADRQVVTLPWGAGDGAVGIEPGGAESLSYGPNAVAIASNGESLILDRINERILRVAADGAVHTVAAVPKDAEELVAGAGSIVAFSPVRGQAWFFDASGSPAGTLAVPRALRELTSLSVGASRRLTVHTGFQERLELGSPSAPLALEVTLRGKREGAFALSDGSAVALRASAGRAELLLLSQGEGEVRSRVLSSRALPGAITAARLLGAHGMTVCLRTERVQSLPELVVDRRAVCVDLASGSVVHDEALPAPGLYLPRTELAFHEGRLCHLHASEAGLVVKNSLVQSKAVAP